MILGLCEWQVTRMRQWSVVLPNYWSANWNHQQFVPAYLCGLNRNMGHSSGISKNYYIWKLQCLQHFHSHLLTLIVPVASGVKPWLTWWIAYWDFDQGSLVGFPCRVKICLSQRPTSVSDCWETLKYSLGQLLRTSDTGLDTNEEDSTTEVIWKILSLSMLRLCFQSILFDDKLPALPRMHSYES